MHLDASFTVPFMRRSGFLAAPLLLALSALCPLRAHPHMFIDVRTTFVVTDSSLDGFHVEWDFDEMNSEMLVDEFDANRNGHFDSSEIPTLEKEAFSLALRSNAFIAFTWANSFLKIARVEDFSASVVPSNTVRYSFYVPCDIPLAKIEGKKLRMFLDDPSMYIAFTLDKNDIRCRTSNNVETSVSFDKMDYLDRIVLTIRTRPQ